MLKENDLHPPLVETSRLVFLKGLVLEAYIGAYEHEQGVTQPVKVDLTLELDQPETPVDDNLENVVCYNRMAKGIEDLLARGHIKLVETLAERIAAFALDHPMVLAATVRVEKPNAIEAAVGAGVEIRRAKR